MVATGPGLFTQSNPADRKVVPDDAVSVTSARIEAARRACAAAVGMERSAAHQRISVR